MNTNILQLNNETMSLIASEVINRTQGDLDIDTKFNTEISSLQSSINTNQTNINHNGSLIASEVTNRTQGDLDLDNKFNTEISSLQSSINTNQTNINHNGSIIQQLILLHPELFYVTSAVIFDSNQTSSNITLLDNGTKVLKQSDTYLASTYSIDPIDFKMFDYKIKLTLSQNSIGSALPIFGIVQHRTDLKLSTLTTYARFDRITEWGQGFMIWIDSEGVVKINEYDPSAARVYTTSLSSLTNLNDYIEIELRVINENEVKLTGDIVTNTGSISIHSVNMVRNSINVSPYYIIVGDASDVASSMEATIEITSMPRDISYNEMPIATQPS